jgi:hypothetical protein
MLAGGGGFAPILNDSYIRGRDYEERVLGVSGVAHFEGRDSGNRCQRSEKHFADLRIAVS